MNSITEIFENSKHLFDSISNFVDKSIGCDLLRKCNITKIVDDISNDTGFTYCDNPIFRLIGNPEKPSVLKK